MSFQNYENFPSQQGAPDAGAAGVGPNPDQMGAQMPGSAGGQYEGGDAGPPGSAGGQQQEGDAKTTLWYVGSNTPIQVNLRKSWTAQCLTRHCKDQTLTLRTGWVN